MIILKKIKHSFPQKNKSCFQQKKQYFIGKKEKTVKSYDYNSYDYAAKCKRFGFLDLLMHKWFRIVSITAFL